MDKVTAKALKIWQNHLTADSKIELINNSESVDLDTDWENIDPEDETNS